MWLFMSFLSDENIKAREIGYADFLEHIYF